MTHPSLTCKGLLMNADTSCRNPNPNYSEAALAFHFMRALFLIQQKTAPCTPSHAIRCRQIRRAAHASMAHSAGPRRAWGRALLRKLRSGARLIRSTVPAPTLRVHEAVVIPRRRIRVAGPQEWTLRQLVPGGGSMDYCDLLEEAVDYIRCLSTQVKLMQAIVASFS